jgi:hypothetical protein
MRFRLGPRPSSTHIAGWSIASKTADSVVLEVRSSVATGRKVVRAQSSRVVMTTFVRYERRMGRIVCTAVTPIHHRTEPYLLGHAAAQAP